MIIKEWIFLEWGWILEEGFIGFERGCKAIFILDVILL